MSLPSVSRFRAVVPLLLVLQVFWAMCAFAGQPFEWLDVRRKGADAILEFGRQRAAPKPWQRTFRADVPAGHPWAGLKFTVARSYAGRPQLMVRIVAGPAQLVGTGVVVDGAKAWIRIAGDKAKPLPNETLFRAQPILDIPWSVFCGLEWLGQFSATIEGEFDQVAVVRLTPRYELGVTARPSKISISKIHGYPVASAINDGKGNKLGEVDWQAFDGQGLPAEMLLRGPGENTQPVRFISEGAVTAPGKQAFTAAALK